MVEQLLPVPTPMTVIGVQVAPMRTLRSWTTMPSALNRAAPDADPACRFRASASSPDNDNGIRWAYGFGGVAALKIPGGAIGTSVECDRVGSRKERESGEGSESKGANEHHLAGECGWLVGGEGGMGDSTWGILLVFGLFLYVSEQTLLPLPSVLSS